MAEGEIQVLEFELGSETYCVGIDNVAEVVDTVELTPLPNEPDHVEGVMDLRGRTTSIIDPGRVLDLDGEGIRHRVIVFDPTETDGGNALGWLVDEVEQVGSIDPKAADDAPNEDEVIRGIVHRNDDFIIWVDPEPING